MGDGVTRSRKKDGWHLNWERARRKEKGRRRTKIRDNTVVEFHHHHGLCGLRAAEREFVKLRAQPTAKAKAKAIMYDEGAYHV